MRAILIEVVYLLVRDKTPRKFSKYRLLQKFKRAKPYESEVLEVCLSLYFVKRWDSFERVRPSTKTPTSLNGDMLLYVSIQSSRLGAQSGVPLSWKVLKGNVKKRQLYTNGATILLQSGAPWGISRQVLSQVSLLILFGFRFSNSLHCSYLWFFTQDIKVVL